MRAVPRAAPIGGAAGHENGVPMRALLWIISLIAILTGGVWLGGESWLAGRAAAVIAQREDIGAEQVQPLREMRRIGIRLDGVDYRTRIAARPADLRLPWIEFWVPPTAPVEAHATLPEQAALLLDGTEIAAAATGGKAVLRFAPANDMAVTRMMLNADSVLLAERPLLEHVAASARLVSMGHDAPREAGAAYDVDLDLTGFDPAVLAVLGLPPLVLPGQVALAGETRLWLETAPGPGMLQGRDQPVRPVGFRSEGMALTIGDLQARLVGEVVADDQGRPAGRLALYSPDGQAWLRALSDAGLLPPAGVALGGALLRGLSQIPMELPHTSEATPSRNTFSFPEPAEGETRLPIFLREGKVFLGAFAIGTLPVPGQG